ncbi:hypothetical protein RB195_022528 [Necator americanus]|uniref:Uncharacterized protein n=1 Tax=Necator americanus TaxID=51031 RepID=A0ABR1EHU7_NECAM
MQPSFKKVQDGAREHPLYYLRPKSIHANHIALSTTKSRVFTASRFSSSFLQHLMAIVTTAIVALSSTDPISSSSDSLSEYHMIECRPKDVYINSLNAEAYERERTNTTSPRIRHKYTRSCLFLLMIFCIIMKLDGKSKWQTSI